MEFLIGDAAKTFVDEEKLQNWTVTQPDPRSMRWQAVTSNAGHNWQITKMIFADPSNSTLIQQTTFQALNGKTVGNFNLYLLYKPYLKNAAANNSGSTVVADGNTYLVASSSDSSEYSAVGASLGWTVENGVTMASSGYYGVNDGWQDLLGGSPPGYTMKWAYNSAANGNIAQMGWLNTAGNSATSITFMVVVGFGSTQANAIAAANNTLSGEYLEPADRLRRRLAQLCRRPQHPERHGRQSVLSVGDDAEVHAGQEQRRDDRRDRHALGSRRRR